MRRQPHDTGNRSFRVRHSPKDAAGESPNDYADRREAGFRGCFLWYSRRWAPAAQRRGLTCVPGGPAPACSTFPSWRCCLAALNLFPAAPAQAQTLGDFNGDGRDDVLLRHTDGRWYYYPMNGPRYIDSGRGAANLTRNTDWAVAGIGDLNGDGNDDVLLRRSDGHWHYYAMNGRRYTSSGRANLTRNTDYSVAGIGDFNGDGNDDVLLRHTDGRWYYYPMNGPRYINDGRGGASLTRNTDWAVAGIGDLNGDGNDDVLLRRSDGHWHYYAMNGRRYTSSGRANLTRNTDYSVAGIGDFNGDGNDDVLLRHTDGRWYYYPMNGPRYINDGRGAANLTRNTDWAVAGIGDLNGDGNDDVLLRRSDGHWHYYAMNGRRYTSSGRANLTRNTDYAIAGAAAGDSPSEPPETGRPDLVVDSPSVSASTLSPGESFTLRATVRNRGTARSDSTRLRYYRSTNSSISGSDTEVGTDPVGALAASATSAESIRLDAPSSARTWYYGACVNSVNGETNTGNNCSGGVRVTVDSGDTGGGGGNGSGDDHSNTRSGATSLSPNGSRAGRIDPSDDTDYFSVRLGESGALTVYSTGSLDTTGELQNSSGSALGSDDDSGSGRNFRIEREVSAGTYYIKVESYRTNTGSYTLHADFSGGGGDSSPDLTVDTPTVSNNSLSAGSAFTLRAVVRNRGNGSAAATTLRYYRSANSTISAGDTVQGTDPVAALAASDSSSESIRLDAPSSTGTYYYGACVDTVSGEGDTGNNCSGGVRVTVGDDGGGGGTGGDGGTGGSGGAAIPPVMVSISGGTFRMGDLSGEELRELPAHSVTVPAFRMGKYEVTFAQWDACLADGGCNGHRPNDVGWGRGNRPVINVSWNDVQGFIDWLNGKTGGSYRLPTEAEWEYAARAGSATKYSWGNDIGGNRANCYNDVCGDSYEFTAPGGFVSCQCLGFARHARQRVGMGAGLLQR